MLGQELFACSFVPRDMMHLRRRSFSEEKKAVKVKVKEINLGTLYIFFIKEQIYRK
jgi:hypothetical protein